MWENLLQVPTSGDIRAAASYKYANTRDVANQLATYLRNSGVDATDVSPPYIPPLTLSGSVEDLRQFS
ncbi:hypothetical protein ACN23B_28600 (plasmid) [Anabaena sp. FACHB-709]|uniref:Uncharacterized protein n=1 Tax=Anabaena cylindrica FACHB-318 TaxID=2692880 RepID=A0ABR7ZQW5_ANACY|nr:MULTISPECIES: hypothetical protein [Nostocaceae]MBD2175120.1 hypothetical protein [Anabaena cylindrica FACHB-318]MBD2267013.1 hypothetical protein [Anabaena sp. FACHB-709]MBD2276563.1 hypothetical protein [Nostoc sp. PCC 7120 = FACHB-418]MBD2287085.1 hypothetical protein [Anabaena cylindrica FACHB-170]MBD2352995.1 hypothetical protein [Trichormus variabilis FACHB-171]